MKESTVFSRKYCTEVTNLSTLSVFEVEIWCYRGGDTIPKWIMRNAGKQLSICNPWSFAHEIITSRQLLDPMLRESRPLPAGG